ncbi:MAG: DUF3558 domain-containing protein [Thermocrispum sp.]
MRIIGVALAAGLALAGCSDEESGQPTAAGGPVTAPTGAGEPTADGPDNPGGGNTGADAPKVPDPIPAAVIEKFRKDPCALLTSGQMSGFGYTKAEPKESETTGPGCDWSGDDGGSSMSLPPERILGMSGPYSQKHTYKYFEPISVGGYPALFADTYDDRNKGGCGLPVALTDDQLMTTAAQFRPTSPYYQSGACDQLKLAAEAAMETIKAAS